MRDQHCVSHIALRVFVDLAQRSIMNPQLGQRFAGRELEIANDVIAFRRRRIIGGNRGANRYELKNAADVNSLRSSISACRFQRLDRIRLFGTNDCR